VACADRNKIISDLFVSKEFNDCIRKMEPIDLQDDLRAEVALILCEHSDEKIISIYNSHPNALKYYTVRIILNLIKSNTSPFYKKYRQPVGQFNDEYDHSDDNENIDIRLANELKEEKALSIIDSMYWYDKEMIKLYMETGNYRKMQKVTGIPWGSCYDTIQMALNKIRYELRKSC
jgi:hypothetical protein